MNEIATVLDTSAAAAVPAANHANEKLIFKSCAAFTDRVSKINNTHVDNAKCSNDDV